MTCKKNGWESSGKREPSLKVFVIFKIICGNKILHVVLNAQVVTTPPHVPQYESFFINIAEEFVICGKVSFCRKRLLAYKHGNFMAINN